jgi:hypothetical protein
MVKIFRNGLEISPENIAKGDFLVIAAGPAPAMNRRQLDKSVLNALGNPKTDPDPLTTVMGEAVAIFMEGKEIVIRVREGERLREVMFDPATGKFILRTVGFIRRIIRAVKNFF